ncbi:hypothetical protein FA95DRAFT_1059148 [Auriscalpium vulgare]|uniref:Uncharacterized protein n=1 Tax=Auriscalpium vulgare TaxID=40419 RepID=A0ACB8SA93_9AGAM|nr:hypothetical protein FA95DRAFT_1059148 [Auriscalpium vulgare]
MGGAAPSTTPAQPLGGSSAVNKPLFGATNPSAATSSAPSSNPLFGGGTAASTAGPGAPGATGASTSSNPSPFSGLFGGKPADTSGAAKPGGLFGSLGANAATTNLTPAGEVELTLWHVLPDLHILE